MKRADCKGFTLIELMIVVAIIGMPAAIAIPNFANYQRNSKVSEARICLHSVAVAQMAYYGERDEYVVCAANPALAPGKNRQAWNSANGDFELIGFEPKDTRVYYQYESTSANIGLDFTATATGDLDGDGTLAVFQIQNDTEFVGPAIAGAY